MSVIQRHPGHSIAPGGHFKVAKMSPRFLGKCPACEILKSSLAKLELLRTPYPATEQTKWQQGN